MPILDDDESRVNIADHGERNDDASLDAWIESTVQRMFDDVGEEQRRTA